MKYILPKFIIYFILLTVLFSFVQKASATAYYPKFSQSKGVNIGAAVGNYTLSITGYQSPYTSIVITTIDGVFIGSTTADSNGYFSISNSLISDTMTGFCIKAVDFKRLGESDSCINLDAKPTQNLFYNDIFLPPTFGLDKKTINAGQNAIIYGYTMPNAIVYLNIEGEIIQLTADANGFYTYIYKNVPAGVFRISATAKFKNKDSLKPTNKAVLEVLSLPQQVTQLTTNQIQKVNKNIPYGLIFFLSILLFFFIAIGILLYKLRFRLWVIFVDFLRRRKKMHHDWFLDIW